MFSFPLTFVDEEGLRRHVLSHRGWYAGVLGDRAGDRPGDKPGDKPGDRLAAVRLGAEVARLRAERDALLRHGAAARSTPASTHKGARYEEAVQMVLRCSLEPYGLRMERGTGRGLDLFVINDASGMRVGIECKDKKVVTRDDMDKWARDVAVGHETLCGSVLVSRGDKVTGVKPPLYLRTSSMLVVKEADVEMAVKACVPFILLCFARNGGDEGAQETVEAARTLLQAMYGVFDKIKQGVREMDKLFEDGTRILGLQLKRQRGKF